MSAAEKALELFQEYATRAVELLELQPNTRRTVAYDGRKYTQAEALAAAAVYGSLAQAAASAAATFAQMEAQP